MTTLEQQLAEALAEATRIKAAIKAAAEAKQFKVGVTVAGPFGRGDKARTVVGTLVAIKGAVGLVLVVQDFDTYKIPLSKLTEGGATGTIAGTTEAWENGTLGTSLEHATLAPEDSIPKPVATSVQADPAPEHLLSPAEDEALLAAASAGADLKGSDEPAWNPEPDTVAPDSAAPIALSPSELADLLGA